MLLTIGQGLGLNHAKINGGISSPDEISDLGFWLDAQSYDKITFVSTAGDGQPVDTVEGAQDGAAYGVFSDSPTYRYNYVASGLHGKPAFRQAHPRAVFRDEGAGTPAKYTDAVTYIFFCSGIFDGTEDRGYFGTLTHNPSGFYAENETTLQWYNDGTLGVVDFAGTYDLNDMTMMAASIASDAAGNLKINDNAFQALDPNDGWNNNGSFRIGARSTVVEGCFNEIYGVLLYERALTEDELNQIYAWGLARYG